MQQLACYQIDAFTAEPFAGNPAAVVLLPPAALLLPDSLRQSIAAEMNLSETAFLEVLPDDASSTGGNNATGEGNSSSSSSSAGFATASRFRLRWFTPAIEVPLCGHATLAAAAALFFGEANPSSQLCFETLSGELRVTRVPSAAAGGSGGGSTGGDALAMDLPLLESTADVPQGMEAGSALVQAAIGGLPVQEVRYAPRLRYLLVVLRDEGPPTRDAFLALQPNSQQLGGAHTGGQLVGVIVSMRGDGERHDFVSRFFAPWAGIDEDPVTGSAHSVLGPYWAQVLGRQRLRARQCSPRGGELSVDVRTEEGRVTVSGSAVIVLKGSLYLPSS